MVNSNKKALGIIFPNSYDNWVPELVNVRLMASIPFASRYRMVDFVLSSMANSGIDNISVIVKKNYHSLMDHLGSGREWDLLLALSVRFLYRKVRPLYPCKRKRSGMRRP